MGAELSAEIQARVAAGREEMARGLSEGVTGVELCRGMSQVYDELIREVWERAMTAIPEARERGFALVGTGGWGREELCPYSDIDFLLLAEEGDEELARSFAETLLYPLWDGKVKVGHAVRSVRSATELAREDLATATALLDARLIVGDEAPFDELQRQTRRAIAPGGNANRFVRELADSLEERHSRFGGSLYLLEPNLKQGIGGLRDYSAAHWAAKARWSIGSLDELVGIGELTRRQCQVLSRGLDYLLTLRCALQLKRGRGGDQLSFEMQEAIAPAFFPYVQPPDNGAIPAVAPAVETLMRKYYLCGRGIQRVGSRILEAATVPERRRPRIYKIDGSFLLWNGKLAVRDPGIFQRSPWEMLRYFRLAQERQVPLYGHTRELIEAQVAESGESMAGEPRCSALFLEALVDLEDKGKPSLMQEMHAVGLLAAMMPEFGPCTGRIQHDLYHVYTVDVHQLYALAMLKATARGELGEEGKTAQEAYWELTNPRPLFLATLLHDVGKPYGSGHAENGARIANTIATRLGLPATEVAMVEFLVRQHLSMSHLSQRRDLSDPEVIEKFARLVGDLESLHQLYLLTRCDTAMTAPGNLSAWKDQLLGELYLRTRAYFRDSDEMESQQAMHRRQARQRAVEIVSHQGEDLSLAARAEGVINRLDPAFVNGLSARQLSRLVAAALRLVDGDKTIEMSAQKIPGREQSELLLAAPDTPALLSVVAGIISASRLSVDSAAVATVRIGERDVALDFFRLRDSRGEAIPSDDRRWERLKRQVEEVLGAEDRYALIESMMEKSASSNYSLKPRISSREDTVVKVFDEESADYSVIEVHAPDRLGLLHHITRVLAQAGVDIHRSLVSTEGDRAADVFYVSCGNDQHKLTKAESAALEQKLKSAIMTLVEERAS